MKKINRRDFIKTLAAGGAALGLGNIALGSVAKSPQDTWLPESKAVVSVVRIKHDDIDYAVRNAIDLLGGIRSITRGKEHIMLKPNLVSLKPSDVTKPSVIKALAQLMKEAGKFVSIGEGSATAGPNIRSDGGICATKNREMLNDIQKIVFDTLGYSDLAKTLKIPLINLHTGQMSRCKYPMALSTKRSACITL